MSLGICWEGLRASREGLIAIWEGPQSQLASGGETDGWTDRQMKKSPYVMIPKVIVPYGAVAQKVTEKGGRERKRGGKASRFTRSERHL